MAHKSHSSSDIYIYIYERLSIIITGILIGIITLCGIVLASSHTSAESATATVTVGSACTLTATVNTAHSAEIPAGSSQTDIGSTTLNTICNDAGGFAIYAVGYSGNEYGNNKMLSGSSYEFNTGTGTSASNWNMMLSQVTTGTYATTIDGGFGSYSAIPSTFTKVAHRDSATDAVSANPATGSSISLTYGAYISSTQNAGTYEGKVKFTLVHPANEVPLAPQTTEAGCIRYYPNGSNVEGTMGCQPITSSDTSATLLASNFSREGYGFAGWSTTYDYSDSTGFLGPSEDITFTAGQYTGSNPGLSLYAHWIKSAGNLQGWTGCSSLTSGEVTALKDLRDNDVYAVAKLADGNCWMIENSRLDNTNSDNATGALAQGYGGQFAGLANPEAPWTENVTTANSLYSTDGANGTINIGITNADSRFPRYNNQNTTSRANETTNNQTNIYSYGNYYTWNTAIADTLNHPDNNANVEGTSICPSGWHLPSGGGAYASDSTNGVNVTGSPNTYREFYNLGYALMGVVAYNPDIGYTSCYAGDIKNTAGDNASEAFRKYPNNFIYSGYILNNVVGNRGSIGNFYTSTTSGLTGAYGMYLYHDSVYPGTNNNYRYYGRTIRCLISGS